MFRLRKIHSPVASGMNQKARAQAQRNQQKESFQLHIRKRYVVLAVLLMVIALLISLVPREQWLPIEKIRITGEFRQLDTDRLQQQLKPYLGQGFFSVDIQQMQDLIAQQAWIREVSVRRVWPSQIMVDVVEREAFARWDDQHLLSNRAQIFAAQGKAFQHLPLINGYAEESAQLLQTYVRYRQQFGQYGIKLSALHEDGKGSVRLLLDDHLRVNLGTDDVDQKINNMLAVYPMQIKPKTQQIEYIDFRYSNGFAIAWKNENQQKLSETLRSIKNV